MFVKLRFQCGSRDSAARQIVEEAQQVDEVLLAFVRQSPKRKPQPADRPGQTVEAGS
jgi:hypothetical protein